MRSIRSLVAASWCVLALLATRANADPVGTAFTYQGELLQGGSPVTTPVTLVFRLFDAPAGGAQIGAAVSVPGVTPAANGRFKVDLDFGAVALGDAARWLEIQVGATTLSRQRLAVAPYAFRAQVAASASTAALAATSTDAAALAGQPASFYQNAANLISGTLPDSRLSANVPRLGLSNAFSGALNTFAGNVSIGTAMSGERLSVAGVVHATAGGFRFPNGSLQLVASPPTTVFVVGPEATDPYSTIQAAVAAAQASGLPATVAVKPGTYAGSVTITTPGTWVVAVGGAHSARLNGCVTVALSAAGRAGWSGIDIRCTGADAFLVSGTAHALVRLDDAVVTATTGHAVTMACSGTAGGARSRLECSGVDARSLTSLEAVLLMAANAEVVYARGILAKQDPDPEPKPRPDNGKGLEAPVGDCRLEDVEVDCEVDASGSAKVRLTRCDVATVDTRAVRARQSAELEARQCVISSGTAECARCDDSATVTVASCTLRTSRAEACVVAGAASVRYAAVAFDGGARRMALAAQPLNADELLRVTRYVVGPGGAGLWSLQDAINSACAVSTLSGEPQTVYVMPGVYAGPINVPGGRVTLAAAVPGTVRIDGPITVSTGVGGNVMFVDLECSAQFTAVSTTFGVGGVFTLQRCTVRSELGAAVALDGSAGGSASMFGSTIVPGAGSAGVQSVGGVSFNSGLSIMNSTVGPSPFSPSFSGRSLSLQRTDLGPCDGTTFNAPVELAASTASIHRATFRTGTGAVLTLDAASTAVMTHCTVDTPTDPCMTAPTLGSLRVGSLAYLSAGDTLPATATLLDVDAGLHVPRTDRPAAITAPYTFTVTPSLLDSPPMSVSSTSLVPNLNADMLDGLHAAAFMSAGATLGGDCSGAIGAVSVDRIKGRSVSDATPTEGQVLKFTGGTWAPGPDAGAAYVQGPGISISGGTISVATLGVTSGMLAPDSVNGSTVADGTISSADLQFDPASLTRVSGGRMTVDGLSVVVGPPSGALSDFSVRAFDPARSAVALSHADPFTLKPTLTAEGSGRNTWCTEVRVTDPAGNQPALRASSVSLSPAASALVAEIPAGPGSAIVGINPGAGFAVFGQGRLGSTGPKPFHIDHPLDPANRFLTHYAAEGPQPLNLYRGTVLCDADGRAQVVLPSYYESINTDPQYQLTCVGGFAPVFIESEIADGRFVIAGGRPGLKVCWQVTAARNDAYIRAYGAPVETDKPAEFRGRYLHPELVGRPAGEGIFRPASDRQNPVAQRP